MRLSGMWLGTVACAAWLAVGDGLAGADAPVLHEYVPNVQPYEAALALSSARGETEAIIYEGELLDPPEAEGAGGLRPMRAGAGDGLGREEAGRRSPFFRPDRQTQLEETLRYDAGFSPTIAPFKRLTALDQVVLDGDGETPLLRVHDESRETLEVPGPDAPAPDARPRDRFWGQARLDFAEGALLPLPSVAPEARILSVQVEPRVALRFEKDRADNFFVTFEGQRPEQPVRLTFLTDAPRSYFGAPIPDVSAAALARGVPPMPRQVRRRALDVARRLGLEPGARLPEVLRRLTAHFRSFEESAQPPDDSGDILADLVQGKKGVCRHRSWGFVILAQGLGVPARFVQNEAHSWVEVKLPGPGWMRIDLGGAAQGLEARGASDRPVYQPAYADDLPRPAAYERSYSQLAGQVQGLRTRDLERITGRWLTRDSRADDIAPDDAPALGVALDPSVSPRGAAADREPLIVEVDQRRIQVARGELLRVSGRVGDREGRGLEGMRVEVSLTAEDARRTLLLGVTVTAEGGRFSGRFGVPPDLPPDDYRLVVIAPGDRRYAPAMAR